MTMNVRERGNLTLVIGVDGSGKSTFMTELNRQFGMVTLEPTRTPEARAFKAAHIHTSLDAALVNARERIFLDLNEKFDRTLQAEMDAGNHVATIGSQLVTRFSHALMRIVIGEEHPARADEAVWRWMDGDGLKPDAIAFVHAPDEVIRQRIQQRQTVGDNMERPWGFNSPYFLSRYQEAWHGALGVVAANTSIRQCSLDSSRLTPGQMVEVYTETSV